MCVSNVFYKVWKASVLINSAQSSYEQKCIIATTELLIMSTSPWGFQKLKEITWQGNESVTESEMLASEHKLNSSAKTTATVDLILNI